MSERWYQTAAIQSIFDYYISGYTGNPIICLPTGTGKSHVISGFLHRVFTMYAGQRVMMLTHVKELIEQNADKLRKQWPEAPLGIYSAGLNEKDTAMPIIFGGVQSVANNVAAFGWRDLIIVDECHLISPEEDTTYRFVINELKKVNPNLKVIGLTATAYRLGQGRIIDDGLFTDVCFDMTSMENFNRLIAEGYLCTLVPRRTRTELDVSSVKMARGDFSNKQLQSAVDKHEVTFAAIQELVNLGVDRRAWLIFASGVEHAEHICEMLKYFGVTAETVHSKKKNKGPNGNDEIIKKFKAGYIRAVVNYGKLTTGFDYPQIDLIGMFRPTMSPGLWVQMLGRGTRPVYAYGFDLNTIEGRLAAIANSTKKNCLVLDFAGNTKRLGPINDPVLPRKKGKGGGEAPVKICEECGTFNHISARNCVYCGAEFQFQSKLIKTSSSAELIKSDIPQYETFSVVTTIYKLHQSKKEAADTFKKFCLKVTYYCGLNRFDEYVHLEAEKGAGKRARDWWRKRYVGAPMSDGSEFVPNKCEMAILYTNSLKQPKTITVHVNKEYPEIVNYEF